MSLNIKAYNQQLPGLTKSVATTCIWNLNERCVGAVLNMAAPTDTTTCAILDATFMKSNFAM